MSKQEKQDRAFEIFIALCEETCRHDHGESDERLILEYLEREYGVSSCRYSWDQDRKVESML